MIRARTGNSSHRGALYFLSSRVLRSSSSFSSSSSSSRCSSSSSSLSSLFSSSSFFSTFTHRGVNDADIPHVLSEAQRIGFLSGGTDATNAHVCIDSRSTSSDASEVVKTTSLAFASTSHSHGVFYDLDAYRATLKHLMTVFGENYIHCKAVKSNPLVWALRETIAAGGGCECASMTEVVLSLECGCPPHKVIFDSPCKTREEIRACLQLGVHINADNFYELDRLIEVRATVPNSTSTVGVRINPLLGEGAIAALSVSGKESKFAIAFTQENREKLKNYFNSHPWLNCIHVHVGSQGCSLQMLSEGAHIANSFADEIEEFVGREQVTHVDIGGGLPVNFDSEVTSPSFRDYAHALGTLATPPGSKEEEEEEGEGEEERRRRRRRRERKFFTEFGRAVDAKGAFYASSIEYVKPAGDQGKSVAIMHAGSDLFLRECYCPESFPKRISCFKKSATEDSTFEPLTHTQQQQQQQQQQHDHNDLTADRSGLLDIAGPLCFGGDYIKKNLPVTEKPKEGDVVVVSDVGANTLSMYSRHCSRPSPPVYGYTRSESGAVTLSVLRPAETVQSVMRFWGHGK